MSLLSVTGAGMVTAVGFNAPASLTAIRAGISGTEEVNLWDFEAGEYLSGGKVNLPQWWEGLEKMADLVAPAIYECLIAAKPTPSDEIPILLGIAESDCPTCTDQLNEQLLKEISYRLKTPFHPASAIIPYGPVSGIIGLRESQRILARSEALHCIVAGVDSFMQQEMAEIYMEHRRLLTASNSNGFIPGEAGTAVLVSLPKSSECDHLQVLGVGIGHESATIESEDPVRGNGMAMAISDALAEAGLTIFDTAYRITDINGEHYKFKEATLAAMRFEHGQQRKKLFDLWHPIEYLGEIGAAIGPCLLALAMHAGQKEYAPADTALCHCGSDDGKRAAVVVRFKAGRTD